MANVGIEETKLDNLAVVISDRTGKPLPMKVDDMIDAVGTLKSTTSGKWERPLDWPDLSKMDVSGGNVVYMTSYADEARGFCSFNFTCTTGSYTVEIGSISGSTFTADSTQSFPSRTECSLYYGEPNGTYKVLRVTGAISSFEIYRGHAITIGTFHGYDCNQGIIDIVGNLPSCTISSDFSYMYNLVNMQIGEVTVTGNRSSMFNNCYSLTSLDVGGWDTSSVTSMSSMFNGCCSLTSLDVSEWDTSSVTNMSSMFSGCNSLTYLDVSGWDTSKVTSMSSMFSGCNSLTSLDVGGWDTSKVTGMNLMFNSCYSLTSLDVSGWDTSKVTNMSNMFYYCNSLTSIDVSGWNTSSVTSMYYLFNNCSSLTSLDVGGWDTSKVTSTGNMFYNCLSLTSLDVSGWDTSLVTTMSNMFYNCRSLKSLDVSGWDTSSVTSMASMFVSCCALTFLDVSKWDFTSATGSTSTASMFNSCYGLYGSITFPSTVTQIGTSCFSDMRSINEWHFKSTTPPTLSSTNAFNNMTDYGGKKIYVPSASLSSYQTASNWSTYASYMVGE